VVDLTLRSELAHFTAHAGLVASAIVMWWPVLSPVPELPRLPYGGQMVYLFIQSIVPTVPASFLTFAGEPIYGFYETVPRPWDISVLTDQRVAGLIMKIGGGLLLWGVIATLFFKWFAEEETEGKDVLKWEDVEHELHEMGLTER
jgi:putative membrane protein